MDAALRALNRFGLGARIGERGALSDPRGWLLDQLQPVSAVIRDSDVPSPEEQTAAFRRLRTAQLQRDQEAIRDARRALQGVLQAERLAALNRRVRTDTPFVERLVAFWSNHLCVSVAAKQQIVPFAGAYEREVVRPHVLGSFTDMVLASARHPAMLLYLDNFQSIGPGSVAALRAERGGRGERGLNENYARELLELHTLGVDGGYDQADVEALARILTGWTLTAIPRDDTDGEPQRFMFRPGLHEPGAKMILGRRYAQRGEAEGEQAIRDLCAHPSTGRFLATKLVRHFVADDPPPEAVEVIEGVFRSTDGDLMEVSRSLVGLEPAWSESSVKFRTPQDWLVAAVRAFRGDRVAPALARVLQPLRHPLWAPDAPEGFGDRRRDWADPQGLMSRAEMARTVAGRVSRMDADPKRLLDVVDVPGDDPLVGFLEDRTIAADERIALALGGPAFQWR